MSSPPHILIIFYSIIYLYHHKLMNIYLVLPVIIQYYFNTFVAQIVSALTIGTTFSWTYPVSLWRLCACMHSHACMMSTYFLISQNALVSLCIFFLSPRIRYVSKEIWLLFPLPENGTRNQDISSVCSLLLVCHCWLSDNQMRKYVWYVCIYIYMYMF